MDVPKFVVDVTIPVCFALDPVKNAQGMVGLTLSGCKQSIVGFFNPIPACLTIEHENPILCLIYEKHELSEKDQERISEVSIKYFTEKEQVSIFV